MWGARQPRLGEAPAAEIETHWDPASAETDSDLAQRVRIEVVVAAGELAQPVSCSIRRLIGK
jgi:hypothetical protein